MKLWGVGEEALPELLKKWNVLEDAEAERRGILDLIRKAFEGEPVVLPVIEYDVAQTLDEIGMDGTTGHVRSVQAHFYPIKDESDQVVSVVSIEEDITDRKRTEDEILRHREPLKVLTARMAPAEEQERGRIARDLHDQVGQTLALARLEMMTLGRRIEDRDLKGKLAEISETLLQVTRDTRNLIQNLSSPTLNALGLSAAIGEFLEDEVGKRHSLRTQFQATGSIGRIGEDIEQLLFRSVRELLLNVVKPARANEVAVRLTQVEDRIEISIRDDGCGFEPNAEPPRPDRKAGYGLFSVRERMIDLEGELGLESRRGVGCVATLRMPITATGPRVD
jgi:signal transduction histidine kinase